MISLSNRLSAIAKMVPSCNVLADVGTDHGHLPVWLLQNGRVKHVLASDIHEGPLRRARETAIQYDLSDRMDTILADGLQYPDSERADVITICGMGGETIISILQTAVWTTENRRLILQPQSKLQELEQWLQAHQYAIDHASLCRDSGKLYLVISVLGGGSWSWSAEQILCMNRDTLFPEYISGALSKARYAKTGLLKSSGDHRDLIARTEERILVLEQYEKECSKW